jgi:hypothetical protein
MRRIAWSDHAKHPAVFQIEPQIRHAPLLIGTMAREAIVGENGPDIAVEIHRQNR